MEKKQPQPVRATPLQPEALERLYDAREVALQCKVSEKSLHRWAREGNIPAVKFGKLWRFRKSSIDAYLDEKMAS
jgi:excisionase family DNA binding protein